jgi:hypothetical protein
MTNLNEADARAVTAERLDLAVKLCELIQRELEGRRHDVDTAEINWGHGGDAGHVVAELAELYQFLGGALDD